MPLEISKIWTGSKKIFGTTVLYPSMPIKLKMSHDFTYKTLSGN